MKNNRCIIIGSGSSIRQGDWKTPSKDLELWNKLKMEYTIGINSCYKYFEPTFICFGDHQFYINNFQELKDQPLIIGKFMPEIAMKQYQNKHNYYIAPNTYLLKYNSNYKGKNSWTEGFYSASLTGLFSLTLAIAMDFKEIFLLGFDYGETDGRTHFYQDEVDLTQKDITNKKALLYRGVGKTRTEKGKEVYNTSNYNRDASGDFKVYKNEKVNIYNVSVNSKINEFPKISYDEFYKILEENPGNIIQSTEREKIIKRVEKFEEKVERKNG